MVLACKVVRNCSFSGLKVQRGGGEAGERFLDVSTKPPQNNLGPKAEEGE